MKNRKLTLELDPALHGWFYDFCKNRNLMMSKVLREYIETLRRMVEGEKEVDKR